MVDWGGLSPKQREKHEKRSKERNKNKMRAKRREKVQNRERGGCEKGVPLRTINIFIKSISESDGIFQAQ
jgi:hypothetical protein